jgi:hypothetical protein
MGMSSDEDELNVVDSHDDDEASPRKIKSVASSASHADRSDLSTTPQSHDESSVTHPPQPELRKRQSESTVRRRSTQKRHLNDNATVMEKRLIEKLTQENQRLKTELEARALNRQQSVIVTTDSANQLTTESLVHPTPAPNSLPFFGFPQPTPNSSTIQSSGSAFSAPQRNGPEIDPATLSLFYSPFGTNTTPLLSMFGNGVGQLGSLNELHALMQQQPVNFWEFRNMVISENRSSSCWRTSPKYAHFEGHSLFRFLFLFYKLPIFSCSQLLLLQTSLLQLLRFHCFLFFNKTTHQLFWERRIKTKQCVLELFASQQASKMHPERARKQVKPGQNSISREKEVRRRRHRRVLVEEENIKS